MSPDRRATTRVSLDQANTDELGTIDVLSPAEAKGLEFDAVIVVESNEMTDPTGGGWRPLFVSLTRAVQQLTLIGTHPPPKPIQTAIAAQVP